MAKASARSRTAASASSGTTTGTGITTLEISELRDTFSTTRSSIPTSPSPTPSWSTRSPRPTSRDELGPNSSTGIGPHGKPQAKISVTMPDGSLLTILTEEVTIEFSRDFQDVTSWSSPTRTYLVDKGTFTIKGKL